jgi:hypothetical protein
MSDCKERFKQKCPRKLDELPKGYCPLAVHRLKWLRSLGREPTEEEELNAPGCNWAINHQMSGYCWFAYEAKFMSETPASDVEIAAALNLSIDTVKQVAESALSKIQNSEFVVEVKKTLEGESVVQESLGVEDEAVYCE